MLTAETRIRVKAPHAQPLRRELTGDTKIKLSQIDWTPAAAMTFDERHKYKPGDRAIWKDGIYQKMPNGSWHKVAEKGEANFATPHARGDRNRFVKALAAAKATQPADKAWRVDSLHKQIDYKRDHICTTKGGSVAAVTPSGDIISVCKRKGDKVRGTDLLAEAIKAGGKKLDSYDGNYEFYKSNGFEPVSWCEFDIKRAPPGWREGIDKPEPIIFFKYTGKNVDIKLGDFYNKVAKSADYAAAEKARDKEVSK